MESGVRQTGTVAAFPLSFRPVTAFPFSHALLFMQGREGNYKVHSGSVDQLCWHPTKADILVTASGDKTIRIWDARGT